jgi:hypothetical protein
LNSAAAASLRWAPSSGNNSFNSFVPLTPLRVMVLQVPVGNTADHRSTSAAARVPSSQPASATSPSPHRPSEPPSSNGCPMYSPRPPGVMVAVAATPRPPAHRWQLCRRARRYAVTSVGARASRLATGLAPVAFLARLGHRGSFWPTRRHGPPLHEEGSRGLISAQRLNPFPNFGFSLNFQKIFQTS